MKKEPQIEEEEAYKILRGCPTLTFALQGVEKMLPYHSFAFGSYQKERITMGFSSGTLTISGAFLHELWEHLQLQDVRFVRCHSSGDVGEIEISLIDWKPQS